MHYLWNMVSPLRIRNLKLINLLLNFCKRKKTENEEQLKKCIDNVVRVDIFSVNINLQRDGAMIKMSNIEINLFKIATGSKLCAN